MREHRVLVAVTALGAIVRFATLDLQSFWFDEAVTVGLVRRTLGSMIAEIADSEGTPPLYYVLAWGWVKLFGTGEIGLRSLSALIGTAAIPVTYSIGSTLISRRAGLVAAAIVATSPMLVWYSQEARAYALLHLLTALSLLFFVRAISRQAPRTDVVAWGVTSALALATHYFAVFVVAAEACWLLFALPSRRLAQATVGTVTAAGAGLVPLALEQHEGGHAATFIAGIPFTYRLNELLQQFVTGQLSVPRESWLVALVAAALLLLFWAWARRERRGVLVAVALAAVAVGAPFGLSLVGLDYFYYRNLISAFVPLAVGVGGIFAADRAGRTGLAAGAAACGLSLILVVGVIPTRPQLLRHDWRQAVSELKARPEPQLVVASPTFEAESVKLYADEVQTPVGSGVRVRSIVVLGYWFFGVSPESRFRAPAGFRRAEARTIGRRLTLIRFQAPAPRLLRPEQVRPAGSSSPAESLVFIGG